MKQKTKTREMMKRDLMRVYREVCANTECKNQTEAYEQTVCHEAPRFYVDVRWAHQRISRMMRGDMSDLSQMSPLGQQMYRDLFEVVMRLSRQEKFWNRKLYYILRYAVHEKAQRFYISAARMGQIWCETTKREKQERMKRYEA